MKVYEIAGVAVKAKPVQVTAAFSESVQLMPVWVAGKVAVAETDAVPEKVDESVSAVVDTAETENVSDMVTVETASDSDEVDESVAKVESVQIANAETGPVPEAVGDVNTVAVQPKVRRLVSDPITEVV
eukprot:TRINITY_DN11424_c0_g1_i1.p3 TRINITY_DN11424_c0_g1~~TRINITY_DN11424_c0_g1_i1.p3  ORF type:complete len:129 (+),score=29.42 TRINITY_DN11424_c0_g1_i1:160-546(+)